MTTSSRKRNLTALTLATFASLACIAQTAPHPDSTTLQSEKALLHQGKIDEAKALTLQDLKQHPTADAFNLLGIIDSEQQDYASALDAFNSALHLSPHSTQAHNNLGNVYVSVKKPDLAEKEFRTVLALDPANQDANYNLGLLLMAKQAPAEAIPHFLRIHPSNLETRFSLIRAYLQVGRTPEALKLATQLSAENNHDVQLHFSLGVLLASLKQYKPAQLELERADALKPGTFEILFNLGQAYFRNNDNPHAELTLSRALQLNPSDPDTLYLLAQVYTQDSRPLDALDLLVRAKKLSPQNPDILYLMAQISISQKYDEDAIPLLQQASALAPTRADIRESLAESFFNSGKYDQSIELFSKLVSIEPSARAYSFLGLSYIALGRFNEAKDNFQKGLRLAPNNTFCLFQLGYIARMQGNTAAAEKMYTEILRSSPNYPHALLELSNIRIESKHYAEAADLLQRYVKVSDNPATGYYKLAMVEKNLHNTSAAEQDLAKFQTLSKETPVASHPFENLFDYIDTRSKLAPHARVQQDLTDLTAQLKLHPDQPEVLYALAEAYLKSGQLEDAKQTLAQLNTARPEDAQTQTKSGVLLARYGLYDDAIPHFLAALHATPNSNDAHFDLADAYFRKGLYTDALDAATQVTPEARKDDAYLSLLGDIYAHLGDTTRAQALYRDAIQRNPDNDQDYLALALLQFRQNDLAAASQTLHSGQLRIPGSGKLIWGLGLAAALKGDTPLATTLFERAVDILPEWPGAYSTLGFFFYQTGQIDKASEVLDRFKNSNVRGGLDIHRIEATLAQAPAIPPGGNKPLSTAQRQQLLQFTLYLADKTL